MLNGNIPVFVDVDYDTFNIDPDKIEKAITDKTEAILPVHFYGIPSDVEKISLIAKKYGLKIIYDVCHAFGVKINNKSILNFGDLSVLSFHATKVFNTFEGGAIVTNDKNLKKKVDELRNFCFLDENTINEIGLNAKMNEFQSIIGILQLKYYDEVIEKKEIYF